MNLQKAMLTLLLGGVISFGYSQNQVTKTNILFGPFFKTAHASQEIKISGKFSVQTTMKVRPASVIAKSLQNLFEVSEDYDNPFSVAKLSGVGNVTQFRYYPKKDSEGLRGFYLGVFGSYMHYKLEAGPFRGTFHDENDVEYSADLKQVIKLNVGGGGFMIGVQGLIKDKICIDWTILGLGFGIMKISGGYEASNTSENFDFRNYTDDISGLTFNAERFLPIKITAEKESVSLSAKAPWPLISTGLSFGFAYGGGGPKAPKTME